MRIAWKAHGLILSWAPGHHPSADTTHHSTTQNCIRILLPFDRRWELTLTTMTVIMESPSPTSSLFSDLATLHALPVSERPRRTWAQALNAVAFGVVFLLGCVLINVVQFVLLLPLRVLCFLPIGRKLYDAGIRRSKGAFGTLLGKF